MSKRDPDKRRALLERLETHQKLKGASPGFHISDEDLSIIISVLREDAELDDWVRSCF
jgi:hypothetical protein